MDRKYELTNEYKDLPNGRKAYRIRALRNFAGVESGDLGGIRGPGRFRGIGK